MNTKEPRVYVINLSETKFNFREAEYRGNFEAIITEAERLGSVYSLEGFEERINDEVLQNFSNTFIYISNKPDSELYLKTGK